MKYITILFAIVMCLLALVHGTPLSSDSNEKCQLNCDLEEFKPVCGTSDAGETKTFSNVCIMKTENCLRSTSFQKTADGNCP